MCAVGDAWIAGPALREMISEAKLAPPSAGRVVKVTFGIGGSCGTRLGQAGQCTAKHALANGSGLLPEAMGFHGSSAGRSLGIRSAGSRNVLTVFPN